MPEDVQPNPDTGKVTEAETVQITKAELENYQASKKFHDEVNSKAQDILGEGYTGEDYMQQVEEEASAALDLRDEISKLKKPEPTVTEPSKTPKAPEVVPAGLSDEDRKTIDEGKRMSTTAFLNSNYTEFIVGQNVLPEEQRSKLGKVELLKFINGAKRSLVGDIAQNDPSFDGNVFKVAVYLINEASGREARAKESKDRDAVIDKAKVAANIDTSTAGAPVTETEKSENEKAADQIIPDDPEPVLT